MDVWTTYFLVMAGIFGVCAIGAIKQSCLEYTTEEDRSKKKTGIIIGIVLIVLAIGFAVWGCLRITPSSDPDPIQRKERCAMCGKQVRADTMIKDWCPSCADDAFGDDGWYYDIKD